MARKKKSKGGTVAMDAPSSSKGHMSTSIDEADNGFIVNVSGDSGGKESKYFSKKFVSPTREGALVIASSCLAGCSVKGGKKKGSKKKISLRKV